MDYNIETLSLEEKVELAEKLWDSIEEERRQQLTPLQQQLLDQRLAAHAKNPGKAKTWESIKQKYFH